MTLRADKLTAAYGERFIFADLSLRVAAGEALIVSGVNGSGKSTLLQVLAGLRRPLSGSVEFDGEAVTRVRARIGYLGHDLLMYRELTLRENLELFAAGHGIGAKSEEGLAANTTENAPKSLLDALQLRTHLEKAAGDCSYGVSKKASIVRALLHNPRLIVFDEPFSGLDRESSESLVTELKHRRDSGAAVILSSHEEQTVSALVTQRLDLSRVTS